MRILLILAALAQAVGEGGTYGVLQSGVGGGGSDLPLDDDVQLQFGDDADAICVYDTGQTPDSLVCGLGTDSERLIVTTKALVGTDLGHADATNPTVTVTDTTGADTVEMSHDGTVGLLTTNVGDLRLNSGSTFINIPEGVNIQGGGKTRLQMGGSVWIDGNIRLSNAAALVPST